MSPATITTTEPRAQTAPWAHLVLNPVAGAGRVGRRSDEILRALLTHVAGDLTLQVTLAPGRAEQAARYAASTGANLVIAIGGDGTVHEVVNGMVAGRHARHRCALGVIDGGTGSGFADSLGLPESVDAMAAGIACGRTRRMDLGRIRLRKDHGGTRTRRFVSECQIGVGGVVCARLGALRKRLGGRLGFGLTSLLTGLRHRAVETIVTLDDARPIRARLLGVVVANGSHTGGGMRMAPDARLDDGRLDVVLIHDVPVHARPSFLAALYEGRHLDGPYATARRACRVRVETKHASPVAADGEVLGTTPLAIEVEPRALLVRVPRNGASS